MEAALYTLCILQYSDGVDADMGCVCGLGRASMRSSARSCRDRASGQGPLNGCRRLLSL